jgi:hypothetical protein
MQTQATDKWHANPLIAHDCGMLSPDCIDLLDRMFELEEPKRWAAHTPACTLLGTSLDTTLTGSKVFRTSALYQ